MLWRPGRVDAGAFGAEDRGWVGALAASDACVSIGTPIATGHFHRRAATAGGDSCCFGPVRIGAVLADGRDFERLAARPTPAPAFRSRAMSAGPWSWPCAVALQPVLDRPAAGLPCQALSRRDVSTPSIDADPVDRLAAAPDGAMVLVMTHSHALDLEIAGGRSRPAPVGALSVSSARRRNGRASPRSCARPGRRRCDRAPGLPDRPAGISGKEPAIDRGVGRGAVPRAARGAAVESGRKSCHGGLASSQGSADRL